MMAAFETPSLNTSRKETH